MENLLTVGHMNFIKALSLALDLTSNGLSEHHFRSAIISYHIAREIGLEQTEIQTLVYASFLHDIGAASNWNERESLMKFHQGPHVFNHAEKGYELMAKSRQFSMVADIIRHHHDRFDGKNPSGKSGEEIPLLSRIIHLADRVDVLHGNHADLYKNTPRMIQRIKDSAGSYFDPILVTAFCKIAGREGFWLDISTSAYHQKFLHELESFSKIRLDSEDMLQMAEVFAALVDATSRFTFNHSRNVAALAGFLAALRGYSREEIKLHKLAGLLHDLGKLAVPNDILEKPERLTEQEFFIVKQHPYFTLRILQQIEGFGMIAGWAGYHHETLGGSGYPFGLGEQSLMLGARIIAVSDIYSALIENRPYRPGFDPEMAGRILGDKAAAGEVDEKIVCDLLNNQAEVQSLLKNSIM